MRTLLLMTCAILLAACSVVGDRSGTEQATYTVVSKIDDDTKIRLYPPQLVAETSVTSEDSESGRNSAFRTLFDYISGDNRERAKVAMTAPVEQPAPSRKIAMTVPVETGRQAGDRYTMRFFLPAEYTLESAPEPTNPAVSLVLLPERTVAVRRFSGSRSDRNVARQLAALNRSLERSEWRAEGAPLTLFYDPPWTLPFLRRNEVALPVVAR